MIARISSRAAALSLLAGSPTTGRTLPSAQAESTALGRDRYRAATVRVAAGGGSDTQRFGVLGFLRSIVDAIRSLFGHSGGSAPTNPSQLPGMPIVPHSKGPQPNDPSTWTDDNCPYGITLAGFSPQDHTDLTVADLGIPGKAEKYAVYNYFLENKTQPTNDWAPAAAASLNARYHTTVYHAIDGETLGYGNEYVHSAPNGYGIPPGTYNPNAKGELFWGCTG